MPHDPRVNHGSISTKQWFFSPFEPLIHHWDELEKLANAEAARTKLVKETENNNGRVGVVAGSRNEGEDFGVIASDLKMLLQIVQETPDIRSYFRTECEMQQREESVTFEMLWTIFSPGTVIYTNTRFNSPEFYMVDQADAGISSKRWDGVSTTPDYWLLKCWCYDWDGSEFVRMAAQCRFKRFEKSMSITKLPAYPVQYNAKSGDLKTLLLTRGKKFARLCRGDSKLSYYVGPGFLHDELFEKIAHGFSKLTSDSHDESVLGRSSEEFSKSPRRSTVSKSLTISKLRIQAHENF